MSEHPTFSKFSCDDCKEWVYNFETGERETYQSGSADNVLPVRRVTEPPCMLGVKCPRGTPEREKETVLSPRNYRMVQLYLEDRAYQSGVIAAGTQDGLQRSAFQIIDAIYESQRRAIAAATRAIV